MDVRTTALTVVTNAALAAADRAFLVERLGGASARLCERFVALFGTNQSGLAAFAESARAKHSAENDLGALGAIFKHERERVVSIAAHQNP